MRRTVWGGYLGGHAEWAEDNEGWLRRYLVLERGTPSHDTFDRVFRILDARMFEQCFRGRIAGLADVIDGVVALDGKTVRGSRDGEDDCRVRKGHAPQNLPALRKFALTLLRQDPQYPKAACVVAAKPLVGFQTIGRRCLG